MRALESLVKPAEDAPYRFACENSQAAGKTCTETDFARKIARYRKRCFWSRGGYCFSGSCMDKQGCKCRRILRMKLWMEGIHPTSKILVIDSRSPEL